MPSETLEAVRSKGLAISTVPMAQNVVAPLALAATKQPPKQLEALLGKVFSPQLVGVDGAK